MMVIKKWMVVSVWLLILTSLNLAKEVFVNVSTQKIGLGQPIEMLIQSKSPIQGYFVKLGGHTFDLFFDGISNGYYEYITYLAIKRSKQPGDYILKL